MGDPPALPSDSQVDVEQIGKAPAWLEQLQEHVEKYCLGQMTNIATQVTLDMFGNVADVIPLQQAA